MLRQRNWLNLGHNFLSSNHRFTWAGQIQSNWWKAHPWINSQWCRQIKSCVLLHVGSKRMPSSKSMSVFYTCILHLSKWSCVWSPVLIYNGFSQTEIFVGFYLPLEKIKLLENLFILKIAFLSLLSFLLLLLSNVPPNSTKQSAKSFHILNSCFASLIGISA